MKTLIFKIALAALVLSSCNMGKQYANYRFGGKNDKPYPPVIAPDFESSEINQITKPASENICREDTVAIETGVTETLYEADTMKSIKKPEVKKSKPNSIVKLNKAVLIKQNPIKKTFRKKTKENSFSNHKPEDLFGLPYSKWANFWEVVSIVLIILSLLVILYYAFFLAGLTTAEMIMLVGVIGLGILVFYGLWKLFEGFLFMFD